MLKIVVALIALWLFIVALLQPVWIVSSLLAGLFRDAAPRFDPLKVPATPFPKEANWSWMYRIGRDRHGRMIWVCFHPNGRETFHYRAPPPAEATKGHPPVEPAALLGWKGFDATSPPWVVLGVSKNATPAQVKRAYRELMMKFHPDRFQHLTPPEISELERDTKIIHAAYERLAKTANG